MEKKTMGTSNQITRNTLKLSSECTSFRTFGAPGANDLEEGDDNQHDPRN